MSATAQGTARCVCGAVSLIVDAVSINSGACHCGTCRRWAGGPFMTTDCGTEVAITGEESISVYDSSEWAERGFCSQCGSHLFYRLKGIGQYMIPVALFGNEISFRFDHQVFIDEKPAHYSFAENTENMTGAEVFAKYGGDT